MHEAESVVAFTGAGISVASGIPDFRSPGGLWERYDPSLYANFQVFLRDPHYYWELARELTPTVYGAEPNPAHVALVELERLGKLTAVITQNVDLLHKRAGTRVPIIKLHGSYETCTCMECGREVPRLDVVERVEAGEAVPRCECGGLIQSGAILFGQPLDGEVVERAFWASQGCDCFLVVGSSLVVTPANQMPVAAKSVGAAVIIANLESTRLDHLADVLLRGDAAETLPALVDRVRALEGADAS